MGKQFSFGLLSRAAYSIRISVATSGIYNLIQFFFDKEEILSYFLEKHLNALLC